MPRKPAVKRYGVDAEYTEHVREYQRNYYHEKRKHDPEDVEKRRAYSRAYYHANKRKVQGRLMLTKYGITTEQYEARLEAQGGVCDICGDAPRESAILCVDHCHDSLAVRGLVCSSCNLMLGHARDNRDNLRKGIEYLDKHLAERNT